MQILPVLFHDDDLKTLFPNPKTRQSFLARSVKNGRISPIRKGYYGLNDPSTGGLMATPYQIASLINASSFIDYHLAMEYYGLAEQSFVSFAAIATLSPFRDFEVHGLAYHAILTPFSLGVIDLVQENGLRFASRERLLVDCVNRPDLSGGYEEVVKMIPLLQGLDESLLLGLLRAYHKDFLYLKVGYLLKTYYRGSLSRAFYHECLKHRSQKKYYFGAKIGNGSYIKAWNLIVPRNSEHFPDRLF
jgi:predicted transcriptional regulator of viral defense system